MCCVDRLKLHPTADIRCSAEFDQNQCSISVQFGRGNQPHSLMGTTLIKNFLLMIISTVLTLAVLVGLFELVSSYRYDKWKEEFKENGDWYGKLTIPSNNEVLMWEYRPSSVGDKYGAVIETNEHGFRDVSHTLEKPDGISRIAFVGDSVTLGIGVENDATFTRLFDREIKARGSSETVETLSFAVDGYSAIQVIELIRAKATAFDPDTVIYVMCMNDFDFVRASGQKIKYFKKPESFFLRTVERVYLKYFGVDYYEYYFENNWDLVLAEILSIRGELAETGADFRVAIMPVFRADDSSGHYSIQALHDNLTTTLRSNDIDVIDLLGILDGVERPADLANGELHLNEAGHQVVATRFVEELH